MKALFILFSTCILSTFCHAQMIKTIAGSGAFGYGGEGGPATDAPITMPLGIAVDHLGNVYYSDNGYPSVVRKIDASGIVTTVAGTGIPGFSGDGGPASAAQIFNPHGIGFDPAGNLYIVDSLARIRKVSTTGIITTFAGIGGAGGYGGDGGPATDARLNRPSNIAADTLGNIYIADNSNYRIRKVDTAGIITTVAGNGISGYSGDGGPATAAQLNAPGGIATDNAGNLYIADGTARIRKVNPAGFISTFAGTGVVGFSGDGGPATAAQISNSYSVSTDHAGNVYYADYLNYRIRKINVTGIISTIGGSGVSGYSEDFCYATNCELTLVMGVAVDGGGNVCFSDYSNRRIRKIVPNNVPTFDHTIVDGLTVCADSAWMLDSLLSITDHNANQGETWSVFNPPVHGVLIGYDTATSTGGTLIPSGFAYNAAAGYLGPDSFSVRIEDCGGASGIISIHFTVADCSALQVQALSLSGPQVYPNPVTNMLYVKSEGRLGDITIVNVTGRVVFCSRFESNFAEIDMTTMPHGMYILKVEGGLFSKVLH